MHIYKKGKQLVINGRDSLLLKRVSNNYAIETTGKLPNLLIINWNVECLPTSFIEKIKISYRIVKFIFGR
jgi:hypothetical protein